ncbi:uncharacterized protein C4orf54 homolog [Pygocentrus nattereri]|uniref:DUF4585 domain-containing protein n=1 Tax=Pygocentrus nattereri TaxID=42514 RepID=A0A3B4CF96_PYGNA|nr:uncharacterized protein C4orf54 homolog [Pygocentrus nattereri]
METLRAALTLGELEAPLKQKQQPTISEVESESNYADLGETNTALSAGSRTNGTKTVKVMFTGEGNQLAVFRWRDTGDAKDSSSPVKTESSVGEEEQEELSYTEMRLGSRCQPEDENATPTADAESHYITTHEIQLTELDHDADCDFGHGSRWDYDDDNLVYSFVDYASFESVNEDGIRAKSSQRMDGQSSRPPKLAATGAPVSTESEPCESDKGTSSDESPCKMRDDRLCSTGQVHMAVKACPPVSAQEEDAHYQTVRNTGVFVNSISKDEALREHGRCFIPAPGRQHLASKLRGKDVNEYSSGASSSVSELDDADKEVRNLTAKSFRSLACPYFDAINLRTSSESSVSEHGLNRWSTFVDWNYGGIGRERGTLEATKLAENKNSNVVTAMSQNLSSESASKIELRSNFRSEAKDVTSTEMMNVSCNMEAGLITKSSHSPMGSCATANVAISKPARSENEAASQPSEVDDGTENTIKKAIFASSLLKNVISKKMQFEQECMEKVQMQHASPCPLDQELDSHRNSTGTNDLQRQTSEAGSRLSVVSLEELGDIMDSVSHLSEEEAQDSSHAPTAEVDVESPNKVAVTSKADPSESKKGQLPCSQKSAFKTWKDGEQVVFKTHPGNDSKPAKMTPSTSEQAMEKKRENANGKTTKMSHLYVPSSHLLCKERGPVKFSGEGVHRETSGTLDRNQGGKPQEITIRLCSTKENNSNRFSIASLLTPNIGRNPVKSHVLSVSDKAPHFMVRDVRDNKWKLHTPIHQVRDVRKLVKSSYRFVSLENVEHKTVPSASHEESQVMKKEPDKAQFPSPMVIKCQSVNTSSGMQRSAKVSGETLRETEMGREISQCTRNDSMRRVACTKQPDPKLVKQKVECRLTNQAALEKLKAAVKTMEQLYVFDRNEWKRKTEAPQVVTDSHVLSLIASEEHRLTGKMDPEDEQRKFTNIESHTDRIRMKPVVQIDAPKTFTTKPESYDSRYLLGPGSSLGSKTAISAQQDRQCSTRGKSSSTKGPLRLKISPSKTKLEEKEVISTTASETLAKPQHSHPALSDSENYLSIPVKSCPTDHNLAPQPRPSQSHPPLQRSPVVTDSWSPESPTATMVCHHTAHPQLLCITPPMDVPVPSTQRKLLLDPTTGQCYLVDTPIPLQPATQRLYFPESGRYLDVPLSVTPGSISPIPLSPAYATPPYFIYPPTLLPLHSQVQSSACSEGDSVGSAPGLYLAPPGVATSSTKPVISITSQQGPRIIAPPSFDGTTMSFVVEHR